MKSHMLLLRVVLNEMGTRCCTSTSRDLKTITARVECEGLSFLTITLPTFCSDLQKGLDIGKVDSSLFLSFKRGKGRLPTLFSGFTSQIFNPQTGALLDEPSTEAIYALRQVSLLFSKVKLPCSDARERKAYAQFIETEKSVKINDQALSELNRLDFATMAVKIWGDVLSSVDRNVYDGNVVPKHGPGSTADRLVGNGKYNQRVWTERLEDSGLHAGEFLFPSWRYYDAAEVDWLDPESEIPVKVISVPKTLKTPRIIAIEPTCMQYVQQGFKELIVGAIERDNLLSPLVGFQWQDPNREMAQKGSRYGRLATLDLSEASDRVSNQLVRLLFQSFPWVTKGIDACRSRKADVPGFGVLRLAKFASMGSALTFPIEAMVFLTIVLIGIERESNASVSRKDLKALKGKVRIYGDDIIVPVEYVRSVVETLEAFGLRVNSDKSFWTGKFRESCGKEYYSGDDVSVVKVREMLPTSRRHVPGIISTVSLRNQMYFAGNWETAAFLDDYLKRLIPLPVVEPESPALGRHSFLGHESQRECRNLQKPLVWAFRESSRSPSSYLDDTDALLKFFLKRSAEPSADKDHLKRAGRPKAVSIKPGWVSST